MNRKHPDGSDIDPAELLPHPPAGPRVLGGQAAIRDGCLQLAAGASKELLIFSRDLDPGLYDQVPFLQEVRRLALDVPHLPVRALVVESRTPVADGHRLVELARRLSSRIAIRRVGEDFRDRPDAFLVADRRGYCLRRLADRPEALVDYASPAESSRLRADFERIWELSEADTELRRLYL